MHSGGNKSNHFHADKHFGRKKSDQIADDRKEFAERNHTIWQIFVLLEPV